MGVVGWLKETERRFAWSLFGTIVGAVGLYLAVLALHEKRPQVTFATLSEVNVFDVHAPVRNLDILFQGQNVQQEEMNLRILTIKIENTGEVDVLENFYDSRLAWGFAVVPGSVIEARVVASNDSYLRSQLRLQLVGDSVVLSKPILERGKWVTLDVLVLHHRQSLPTVSPFGKIAGIDRFGTVRAIPSAPDRRPLMVQVFGGSPTAQVIRALAYPVLFIIAGFGVFGVASFISWLGDRRAKRKRADSVRPFLASPGSDWDKRKFFADIYIEGGFRFLEAAQRLLTRPALLRRRLRVLRPRPQSDWEYLVATTERGDALERVRHDEVLYQLRIGTQPEYTVANRLASANLVTVDKDRERKVRVVEGTKEALTALLAYLNGPISLHGPLEGQAARPEITDGRSVGDDS